MYKKNIYLFFLLLSFNNLNIYADSIGEEIKKNQERFSDIALEIWGFAEMGYQEVKSSNLLANELQNQGFKITKND